METESEEGDGGRHCSGYSEEIRISGIEVHDRCQRRGRHCHPSPAQQSRVWFYLLLQGFRYCGYLILLTTNIVGLTLLMSKILTRSIQYILYRYMGGKQSDWPMEFPRYFFCLIIYLFLLVTYALNNRDLSLIINYQVPLIVGFCLVRGAKNFKKIASQFVHVSEDGSNQVT